MRATSRLLFLIALTMSFCGGPVLAQKLNFISDDAPPTVLVKKINTPIIIDGMLNEAVWSEVEPAKDFAQNFPSDSIPANSQTEIYLAYDEENLYIGVRCHAKGNKFIVPSLRRDYDFFGNDNFTVLFDTYNDKNNAIVFGINPYGVRREALVVNGGQEGRDFDDSWDNKWDGEAKIESNGWTAEMVLPFRTLRYNEGSTQWRFNAYRYDTQSNEISSWISIPQNRFSIDLGFMGRMKWEEPLKKPGKNISVIPYIGNAINRDFEDPTQTEAQNDFNAGGDAKIALTSSLNLDLTVNPDFSQVEVDQQVTNLDRFEIFFPERRQFFLENADLFGGFGANRINPFFSRRIGVAIDTATGQNIQNTILYGARLSGKLNDRFRLGILNMQTAKQEENDLPSFNYTVATAEQRVFDRSAIAVIFANKQAINSEDFGGSFSKFNRVAGIEYRLASKDNRWTGKSTYIRTFTPGIDEAESTHFTQLIYNQRKYRFEWVHLYVGNGFNPEIGFTPRKDYFMISPEASFNFYPETDKISRHTIGFDARVFWKLGKDGNEIISDPALQEWEIEPFWEFRFTNSSNLTLSGVYSDLTLVNDFDPTRLQDDDVFLPAGSNYKFGSFQIQFQSDLRKSFNYSITPLIGTFFNGTRVGVEGSFTYRYQPFGFISLDYTYNRIRLDDPFEAVDLWLVGPRIDFTFTRSIFLTTFIQYNNQLDNLNINARFQWRFKPASDFFLVYTDNYLTNPFDQFGSRNRAIVAKLTYWFNL